MVVVPVSCAASHLLDKDVEALDAFSGKCSISKAFGLGLGLGIFFDATIVNFQFWFGTEKTNPKAFKMEGGRWGLVFFQCPSSNSAFELQTTLTNKVGLVHGTISEPTAGNVDRS